MTSRYTLLLLLCFCFSLSTYAQVVRFVEDPGDSNGPDQLRQIIDNAGNGDTIRFNLPDYSADPDITLEDGVILFERDIVIEGPEGEELTIAGVLPTTELFNMQDPLTVSFINVNLVNGSRSAIWMEGGGNLNLSNVVFDKNQIEDEDGGAIHVANGGFLNINECIFSQNRVINGNGAGISAGDGTFINITQSYFFENRTNGTAGNGGAIYFVPNFSAELKVEGTTFERNTSDQRGGAVYTTSQEPGNLFRNCTFYNNQAENDGGGAIAAGEGSGATYSLEHCTFRSNLASSASGGAIYLDADINCTNSLFSNNFGLSIGDEDFGGGGSVQSGGGNLLEFDDFFGYLQQASSDLLNTTPIFENSGIPQNYGGFAPTIALSETSPGVDDNGQDLGLPNDQRGDPYVRNHNGIVDVGAFEVQPNPSTEPTITGVSSGSTYPGVGDGVTINGSGFSSTTGINFLGVTLVAGTDYTVQSDGVIEVVIPNDANIQTSTSITVTNSSGSGNWTNFDVFGPIIGTVELDYGFHQDTITVFGDNLDFIGSVTIDGQAATVVSNSEFSADIIIPNTVAGEHTLAIGTVIDTATYNRVTVLRCPTSTIAYVRDGASVNVSGNSWLSPLGELYHAFALADGCPIVTEIWVSEGTYVPGAAGTATQATSFELPNDVTVYGGFANVAATPSFGDRDISANATILSGDMGSGVVAYHVLNVEDVTGAELDGVFIEDGDANGFSDDSFGGAVLVKNANISFTEVRFSNNNAGNGGAIAVLDGGTITIEACDFQNNRAATGGALYVQGTGRLQAYDGYFSQNSCDSDGGAVFNSGTLAMENCVFVQNDAGGSGGVIANSTSVGNQAVFTNCTFTLNNAGSQSAGQGGVIYNDAGDFSIRNSILWGNTISGTNTGIASSYVDNGPTGLPNFVNSDVEHFGNVGTNIDEDPLFVGSPGDLTVSTGSPVIDAGQDGLSSRSTDFAGNTRIQGVSIDMGAYESSDVCGGFDISLGSDINGCGNVTLTPDDLSQDSYNWYSTTSPSTPIAMTTSLDITGPTTETYWVEVDSSTCTTVDSINVTLNENPTAAIVSSTHCVDESISINVNLTNGTVFSYQYRIDGGTAQTRTNVSPVDIITGVTISADMLVEVWGVSSDNGCTNADTASQTLFVHPEIVIGTAAVSNVSCNGASDGAIDNTVTGGFSVLSYGWTPVALGTTEDVTGLAPGSYIFEVTDGAGCQKSETYVITEPDPVAPGAVISTTATSCGLDNGVITISGLSSAQAYALAYRDNSGNPLLSLETTDASGKISLSGLEAGVYTDFALDSGGCAATISGGYTVASSSGLAFSVTSQDPTCAGGDGALIIDGLAANTTYDLSYDVGGIPQLSTSVVSSTGGEIQLTNLGTETYDNIQVSLGACNDVDAGVYVLTNPSTPSIATSIVNPTCAGGDGELNISGLTDGFTYEVKWNDGISQSTFQSPTAGTITIMSLSAGTISQIEVDSAGCVSNQETQVLVAPNLPSITVTGVQPSCAGGDGVLEIQGLANGETYDVLWSDGSSQSTSGVVVDDTLKITGFSTGVITGITVDSAGCQSNQESFTFITPGAPVISVSRTNPTCSQGGEIILSGLEDGFSYTVNWDDGAPQSSVEVPTGGEITLSGLTDGIYTGIQVDSAGCVSNSETQTLVLPPNPTFGTTVTDPSCTDGDGVITLDLGVTRPLETLTVSWTFESSPLSKSLTTDVNGQADLLGLLAGEYANLEVVDANDCIGQDVAIYTLSQPLVTPSVSLVGPSTTCDGDPETWSVGTVTNAGSAPLYEWTLNDVLVATGTSFDTVPSNGDVIKLKLTSSDICADGPTFDSLTISVNPVPSAPAITGPASLCAFSNGNEFFVSEVSTSTYSYGTSGGLNLESAINGTIQIQAGGTGGTLQVEETSQFGCLSAPGTLAISVTDVPDPVSGIVGPSSVCELATAVFEVGAVPTGATDFTWSLPTGASILSDTTGLTDSIEVLFGTSSGFIKVNALNVCGAGSGDSIFVSIDSLPESPGIVLGPDDLCEGDQALFQLDPVKHATSYAWTVTGAAIASPNGIDSVLVDALNADFSVEVTPENACGVASTASKNVFVEVVATSPIVGNTAPLCSVQDQTYAVSGTTGSEFSWTVPNGASVDAPGNTAVVTIDFGTLNGNLEVVETTVSGCVGQPQVLPISLTGCALKANIQVDRDSVCVGDSILVTSISSGVDVATQYTWSFGTLADVASSTSEGPHYVTFNAAGSNTINLSVELPGPLHDTSVVVQVFDLPNTILDISGPDTICAGLSAVNFSVNSTLGNSYNWFIPSGAVISSGNGTDVIEVVPGLTDFDVIVQEFGPSGCDGQVDTFSVKVISVPGALGSIVGEAVACQQEQNLVYSVAPSPLADTYQWTLPNDALIVSNPDSNVITVHFGSASDTIRVAGNNSCGIGEASERFIQLDSLPEPIVFSTTQIFACEGDTATYAVSSLGAEFFTWLTPQNGSLLFTDVSGLADTAFVVLGDTSERFSVTAGNAACGNGDTSNVLVNVSSIPALTSLIGPSSLCENAANVPYVVNELPTATGIEWVVTGAASNVSGDTAFVSAGTTDFTIEVWATSSCGNSDTLTQTITIDQLAASLNVGDTTVVCSGDSVTLTASGGGATYQWFLDGVALTDDTLASVFAMEEGQYWAELSLAGCVGYSDTTVLISQAAPVLDLGPDLDVCDSINLTASGFGAEYSFIWFVDGVAESTDSVQVANNFTTTETFIAIVTDPAGCFGTDTVSVTVAEPILPTISPSSGGHLCAGDSVVLSTALGTFDYTWYQDGVILPGVTTSSLMVDTSGFFYATLTRGACVGLTDSVEMTSSLALNVDLGPDQTSCDSVILALPGLPVGTVVSWSLGGSLISSDTAVVANNPGVSETYIVEATDVFGCSESDTITVLVDDNLSAVVDPAGPATVCQGDSLELMANVGSFVYQWFQDGIAIAGETDASFFVQTSGTYSVTLTGGSCFTQSNSVDVAVFSVPVLDLGPDQVSCSEISLEMAGLGGASFDWQVNGNSISSDSIFTYSTQGTASQVVGQLTTVAGCVVADTVLVEVQNTLPIPLDFGDSTFCFGESVIYTAQTTMLTYQWYKNGVVLVGDTLPSLTVAEEGYYYVTGLDGLCGGRSDSVLVDTLTTPMPSVADIAECNSLQEQFEVSDFGAGYTLRWFDDQNNLLTTGTTLIDSTAGVSNYVLEVEAPNGCVGTTQAQIAIDYQISVEAIVTDTAEHEKSIALNVIQNVVGAGNADNLITISASSPQLSNVFAQGDTIIIIEPDDDFSGTATINYTIQNACDAVNGSVNFTITPKTVPDTTLPFVVPDVIAWNFSDILVNDLGAIDISTLTFGGNSLLGGTVSKSNGNVRVKYDQEWEDTLDVVTYWVCDGESSCDTSFLYIPIAARPVSVDELFELTDDPSDENALVLTVYDAVSPNDDGVQDFFRFTFLKGDEEVIPTYIRVSIYSQWGDLAYYDEGYDYTDPEHRFEGRSNQGNGNVQGDYELDSGVYYYMIEWVLEDRAIFDKFEKEQGFFMLKR